MKKPILGMAIILASACAAGAQQASVTPSTERSSENVAAPFGDTSAAQVNLLDTAISESRSSSTATPATSEAAPAPPAPKPNFIYGNRDDYRWQLAIGVGFYRFQSNIINASLVGTNTTVSYFTNSWLAVEGNIVTGFAPAINVNEHVKYFGGGGGIRVGGRRNRFEPWGHVLLGGAHLQPQTANNSRSALAVQAGIGLDYRLHSRFFPFAAKPTGFTPPSSARPRTISRLLSTSSSTSDSLANARIVPASQIPGSLAFH